MSTTALMRVLRILEQLDVEERDRIVGAMLSYYGRKYTYGVGGEVGGAPSATIELTSEEGTVE